MMETIALPEIDNKDEYLVGILSLKHDLLKKTKNYDLKIV